MFTFSLQLMLMQYPYVLTFVKCTKCLSDLQNQRCWVGVIGGTWSGIFKKSSSNVKEMTDVQLLIFDGMAFHICGAA